MTPFLLLFLSLGPLPSSGEAPVASPEEPHRFHVSYARLAVEGTEAYLNIRFFRHDLEQALQEYYDDPAFELGVNPHADSLYVRYFNDRFIVTNTTEPLHATIASSGEEDDMWWYIMQFSSPHPIDALNVKNVLLFELFADQKNIFKVKHIPSDTQLSYYFTQGAEEYTITF